MTPEKKQIEILGSASQQASLPVDIWAKLMKKLIDNADSSNLWPRIKKSFLFCLLDLSRPKVINCFATCGDKLVQRLVLGDSLHASIALYLAPPVNHQDKRRVTNNRYWPFNSRRNQRYVLA